jgi:hypothetical protein
MIVIANQGDGLVEPKVHLDRGDFHTMCGRVIRGAVARRIGDRAHASCQRCILSDMLAREAAESVSA